MNNTPFSLSIVADCPEDVSGGIRSECPEDVSGGIR